MKSILIYFLMVCITIPSYSQSNAPFKGEIDQFIHDDSLNFPPKNAILFIGSSSFKKWTDVQDYFPGYKIINRGFGGSQLSNVTFYADKIIYPYHPKQVLIYCGDNDLVSDKNITADEVFLRIKTLFTNVRKHLPKANICYLSIKYSPSRKYVWEKIKLTNQLAKNFFHNQKNAAFINSNEGMFQANGEVDSSLYQSDMLHMKAAGYKIWQKNILPYLLK